jgi:hypothetical protein
MPVVWSLLDTYDGNVFEHRPNNLAPFTTRLVREPRFRQDLELTLFSRVDSIAPRILSGPMAS